MLARSISQANVCLRRQFRLPVRPRISRRLLATPSGDNEDGGSRGPYTVWNDPLRSSLPSRPEHPLRHQSSFPLSPLHGDDGSEVKTPSKQPQNDLLSQPADIKFLPSEIPKEHFPLGRIRGQRGFEFREHFKKLSVNSLGQPADVIVLRDALCDRPYRPEPKISERKKERIDILARLAAERGLIQQSDVNKNIEAHKPEDPEEPLSEEDFHNLAKQLQQGFTIRQLSRYIEQHEKVQGLESELRTNAGRSVPKNKPVVSRTAWMPGRSGSGEAFAENFMRGYEPEKVEFRGKIVSSLTQKYLLSLRILRECWQIDVNEVIEAVGEIELIIKPIYFELLLKGKKSPLEAISRSLDPNREEQIEAFRSRHAVRITATRNNAVNIVLQVEDELSRVRQLDLDMNRLVSSDGDKEIKEARKHSKTLLNEKILNEISQITETEIKISSTGLVSIYCIDKKPGSGLSNRAHIAQRLILEHFDKFTDRAEHHLACNLAKPTIDFGATRVEALSSLSWRDKLQKWARWTAAMSKSPSNEAKETQAKQFTPSKVVETYSTIEPFDEPGQNKGMETHTQTIESSIQLGRILHRWQSDASFAQFHGKGLNSNDIRTFSSEVDGLSRFLARQKIDADSKSISLRLRFIPSPLREDVMDAPDAFPPVELNLDVNEETFGLSFASMIAINRNVITDVMLPERTMDLRFHQRNISSIESVDGDLHPSVVNFLDSSGLDLKRDQLVTPPTLVIPMPKVSGNSAADASESTEVAEVEYLLAGLEYRNTFTAPFEDWTLSYTSIESGKAGGSRSELYLLPRSSYETPRNDVLSKDESRSFIESGYHLLDQLEKRLIAGVEVEETSKLDIDATKYFDITTGATATSITSPFKYFSEPVQIEKGDVEMYEEDEGLEEQSHELEPLDDLVETAEFSRDGEDGEMGYYEGSREITEQVTYIDQSGEDDVVEDLEAFQKRLAVEAGFASFPGETPKEATSTEDYEVSAEEGAEDVAIAELQDALAAAPEEHGTSQETWIEDTGAKDAEGAAMDSEGKDEKKKE